MGYKNLMCFTVKACAMLFTLSCASATTTTETILYHDKNGKPKRKIVTTIDRTPESQKARPCRWVTKLSHNKKGKPVRKQVKICDYDR